MRLNHAVYALFERLTPELLPQIYRPFSRFPRITPVNPRFAVPYPVVYQLATAVRNHRLFWSLSFFCCQHPPTSIDPILVHIDLSL